MLNRDDYRNCWGREKNSLSIPQKRCIEFDRGCNCLECRRRDSGCGRRRYEEGTRVQLRGIQLQLQDNTIQTIENRANVIFNIVASRQSPYIKYDDATGLVTVQRPGIYHFEWWVSTEGILTGSDTGITFSIITSASHNIKASSPVIAGQITGNALIEIFATAKIPVTIRLVNETNGTVGLAQIPVKANLTVFHVI